MSDSDELAIIRLASRYCGAINRRDAAALEKLFTVDGVLSGLGDDIIGGEVIAKAFAPMLDSVEFVHQMPDVSEITIEGDEARATVGVVEYYRLPGGPITLQIGDYEDRLVRTPDGWKFARRALTVKISAGLTSVPPGTPVG